MKLSDIVTLVKAGYSKAEIAELTKSIDAPEVAESAEPDLLGKMSEIVNKMNDIESRLNANNIQTTEVHENTNIDPAKVLADMIR